MLAGTQRGKRIVLISLIFKDGRDNYNFVHTDGRHVMLPNGELHVLSVRQGDENHLYHCRVLVRPNGQTMTSTSAGRILLVPGISFLIFIVVNI